MYATARSTLGVALAVAAIAMAFLQAALPAAPPADCTAAIVSLSPCVDFITGGSSTPLPACCSQLATVAGSEPRCLCAVLNGGAAQFGVVVNRTQALALPGACKVQTPPVSRCDGNTLKNFVSTQI
ncbi:Non-specific lipid-transfer protein-like protein [Apostasia shenzhenica]|uniref:Non-specific lipid-transfer protein-like protein n=1 Tax=Apostasia shenzhenica TaxID=1088818 RepID=A0A2I0B9C9_9ASPA|nr:Non-specific lipid-transfer protein-like protein [Apostasia shenzhenica]